MHWLSCTVLLWSSNWTKSSFLPCATLAHNNSVLRRLRIRAVRTLTAEHLKAAPGQLETISTLEASVFFSMAAHKRRLRGESSARYALVWDGGFRSRVRATTTAAGWPHDSRGLSAARRALRVALGRG